MYKKKILFLTGTRADYGKLKALIYATKMHNNFEPIILATGMHIQKRYEYTYQEIVKDFKDIKVYKCSNQEITDSMDLVVAKTINVLNKNLKLIEPDLVVVHGDRVETLAASIYCNLHNILIAHIEGGEVSGTADESLRHATTKLSHIHFVSNSNAKKLLKRMGEIEKNIYVIGSPEVDIMVKKDLPSISEVRQRYNIKFQNYGILLFHPVTTLKKKEVEKQCANLFSAVKKSFKKFVIIFPNNDTNSNIIFKHMEELKNKKNFKILPSLRFEYYLTLLKNSEFIIGNSSSGIREAPVYGVRSINLGNRQKNRTKNNFIKNLGFQEKTIAKEIKKSKKNIKKAVFNFGKGNSAKMFIKILEKRSFWSTSKQKYFT